MNYPVENLHNLVPPLKNSLIGLIAFFYVIYNIKSFPHRLSLPFSCEETSGIFAEPVVINRFLSSKM